MQQNPSAAFAKEMSIPDDFPEIMRAWTREVLRAQPEDIYEFSAKYFQRQLEVPTESSEEEALSLENVEAIVTELFNAYDDDKNGYLDSREFRNLLVDLRERVPFIGEDDVYRFMAECDVNGDGQIEYAEFIPIAIQIVQAMYSAQQAAKAERKVEKQVDNLLVKGMTKDELMEVLGNLFVAFDADGNGTISREEFAQGLGSLELGLTKREINTLMMQVDVNHDGDISYQEFMPFAYDLLKKLCEMQLLDQVMAEDQLAVFLRDLFASKTEDVSPGGTPGVLPHEMVFDLLAQARLGLTRMQIYSILSCADVNEDGEINCATFIPRATHVIRSMLNFELDMVEQMDTRMIMEGITAAFDGVDSPCSLPQVQECIMAVDMLDDQDKHALMYMARQQAMSGDGEHIEVAAFLKEVPTFLRTAQQARG